jgi:uncharacterized membrane protein YagU involved in acid resistance
MALETKKRMTKPVTFEERTGSAGDAAVDGLLSGVAAGLVMGVYLVVVGLIAGESVAAVLQQFDSTGNESPLTGLLLHLAVAAVYGALFAVGYRLIGRMLPAVRSQRIGRWIWLPGLLYGLTLWLLAHGLLLPAADSTLREIPAAHFAIAHAIYGVSLALVLLRPDNE